MEPHPIGNAGYPGLWGAIGLLVVLELGSGFAGAVLTGVGAAIVGDAYEMFISGSVKIAVLLLILRIVQSRHPYPVEKRYPFRSLTWPQIVSIGIISVSLPFLVSFVGTAFIWILPIPEWVDEFMRSAFGLDEAMSSMTGKFGVIFVGSVTAPITEELLLRGLILYSFIHRYSYSKAIVLTSLLFAAMHLNPWQGVVALIFGVVFAIIVLRTQSLVGALWIHAVHNALSFSAIFWAGPEQLASTSWEPWPVGWNLLATPVFVLGWYLFLKCTPDRRQEIEERRQAYLHRPDQAPALS